MVSLISSPLFFRFSVSNDLKYDAERDLRDIGAKNIQVHSLNKVRYVHDTRMQTVRRVYWLHYVRVWLNSILFFQFKYGKISSKHNGSVKKGVIFATYSSLIGESQSGGKYKTRFQQLLHWCGEDFDGVVSFQGIISSQDAEPQIPPDEQLVTCTAASAISVFLFKNPRSLTGRFTVSWWRICNDLQMCIMFIFHTLFQLFSEKTCIDLGRSVELKLFEQEPCRPSAF